MNLRKVVLSLAVFLFASLPLALALAQGTYTQIDVPGSILTYVTGIDTAGDVVGFYEDASRINHGFLLSSGTYTTIDYPGATQNTYLYGMNNSGQIVGITRGSISVGFLYNVQTRVFAEISYPGAANTLPISINDGGTIAGWYQSPAALRGFELSGSTYRKISQGATPNAVFGISGSGKLVGDVYTQPITTIFSFSHGHYRRIEIPDARQAELFGINPSGTAIVGRNGSTGFIYQAGTLNTLQFPGVTETVAWSANNAGQAAGWFLDIPRGIDHGFIWTPPADAAKK
jgi:hypothetical protein